jgi:hypothetical protein
MKRSLPDARLRGRATRGWISELSMACGLLLSVMVVGCAGSLDPGVGGGGGTSGGGMGGGPAPGCQTAIFANQCASCHATGSGSAGLDLQSANPETRLVAQMSSTTANGGACEGMTLLVPGSNPAMGVFIDKISMNPPPCGFSMPYGSLPTKADQDCLKAWALSVTTATSPFTGETTP